MCAGMEIQKRTTGSGSHSSPVWLLGLVHGRKEKQGRLGGLDRTQGAWTGHRGRGQDTVEGYRGQDTVEGYRAQGGVDRTQWAWTGHVGMDRTQP